MEVVTKHLRWLALAVLGGLLFLSVSCGGGSGSSPTPDLTVRPTATQAGGNPTTAGSQLTPAPASAAADTGGQIKVLDYRSYVREGYLYYIGQVVNAGKEDATSVVVTATLVGSDGSVVSASDHLRWLNVLPAGATRPFKLFFTSPPASVSGETLSTKSSPDSADTLKDYSSFQITVANVSDQGDTNNPQAFTVQGEVTNTGPADISKTEMAFVGYDSDGKVMAAWNAAGPDNLKAGANGTYGFTVLDPQGIPATYQLIALGH